MKRGDRAYVNADNFKIKMNEISVQYWHRGVLKYSSKRQSCQQWELKSPTLSTTGLGGQCSSNSALIDLWNLEMIQVEHDGQCCEFKSHWMQLYFLLNLFKFVNFVAKCQRCQICVANENLEWLNGYKVNHPLLIKKSGSESFTRWLV